MQLEIANALAGASNAAYFDNPYQSGEIDYLTNGIRIFENGTCRGFVGSNDELVIVAFRGTDIRLNSPYHVIDSAQQWLRNFNLFQNEYVGGIRVHAGFDEDLTRVWDLVGNLIVEQGGEAKPVLLTGHSAGAALATLAANRYKVAGLNIHSAYVFASPRVGNRIFVENYPVPLYRIENMDDLVPHIPLPPIAMHLLDFVLDRLAEILMPVFPNLIPSFASNFEYLHAGKLFFVDWDGDLLYSHTLDEFFEDMINIWDDVEVTNLPGSPIPKTMLDSVRALRTYSTIIPEIIEGTFRFFQNHRMTHHLQYIRQIVSQTS